MSVLLEATALQKRYGEVVALDQFELAVSAGEIVGLVGHNGAGKTTFARAVAGLVHLDGGRVLIAGTDVAQDPERVRSWLGLAPQELALYPTATARENLVVFAGLYGIGPREASARIGVLAEAMALTESLDRRVRDLSGGMQRRLQAATAMVHRPRILLLDEPTVGADPITRDALIAVVRKLADDGTAVVYTTHYLPELDLLDATLAVANRGRIIARGDRRALLGAVPGHAVLGFDGPPPALDPAPPTPTEVHIEGAEIIINATDAATVVASLLVANPPVAHRLRTIEVRPPALDDLYRHLLAHHDT